MIVARIINLTGMQHYQQFESVDKAKKYIQTTYNLQNVAIVIGDGTTIEYKPFQKPQYTSLKQDCSVEFFRITK